MTPDVRVADNPGEHRFEILVDGELAGYTVYERHGDEDAFVHTTIDSHQEGRGLGSVLARHALDATREAGRYAIPVCPFIRHYVQTHPEYADLVPPDRRAEFEVDRDAGRDA